MQKQLFELGQTVATPGALDACERAEMPPRALFMRHASGDFGEHGKFEDITLTPAEDAGGAFETSDDGKLNVWGIRHEGRIISKYILDTGAVVWLITEQDRSATTLLLPEEY